MTKHQQNCNRFSNLRSGTYVVGSLKRQVSFAKEPYKRDDILQKSPIFLRSLLIVATAQQSFRQSIKTDLKSGKRAQLCQKSPTRVCRRRLGVWQKSPRFYQKRPTKVCQKGLGDFQKSPGVCQKRPTESKESDQSLSKKTWSLAKEPQILSKETCQSLSKGTWRLSKIIAQQSVKRDLLCQQRPTMSKETCYVKRDLLFQKRPTMSKETYQSLSKIDLESVKRALESVKRDLQSVKRDLDSMKRALESVKRDPSLTNRPPDRPAAPQ